MLIAHIGAMDCFARGLRIAAAIIEDGVMDQAIKVSDFSYVFSRAAENSQVYTLNQQFYI